MKRSPLRRDPSQISAWKRRSKPINRSNGRRKRQKFERNYGERAPYVRDMACTTECSFDSSENKSISCCGNIQAAHVVARGMGGCNGDRRQLVPLCAAHHRQQGDIGILTFEKLYEVDLSAKALEIAEHLDSLGLE